MAYAPMIAKNIISGASSRRGIFMILTNNGVASIPIKNTTIPAMNVGVVEVPFRGRKIYIGGDRTFEPWSITVLNDTNFKIRNAMERWQNGINNMSDNE